MNKYTVGAVGVASLLAGMVIGGGIVDLKYQRAHVHLYRPPNGPAIVELNTAIPRSLDDFLVEQKGNTRMVPASKYLANFTGRELTAMEDWLNQATKYRVPLHTPKANNPS